MEIFLIQLMEDHIQEDEKLIQLVMMDMINMEIIVLWDGLMQMRLTI